MSYCDVIEGNFIAIMNDFEFIRGPTRVNTLKARLTFNVDLLAEHAQATLLDYGL